MRLFTEVIPTPMEQRIVYGDRLLFLGSCFADEIGGICQGLGFDALTNPFGALYNPASIALALKRLGNENPFTSDEVILVGNEFFSTFSHNSDFWMPSIDALLEKANSHLADAAAHFRLSEWIILSLGTSWIFRYRKTDEIVSNCHKLPAHEFSREFLGIGQSATMLSEIITAYPEKHFILTVSPLRHLKDGLHNNALSKSALLLAVEQLCQEHRNVTYFPAYEILTDELRDYRFYKEDMVHPTEQAVHIIWERFVNFGMAEETIPAMKLAQEVKQMLRHKPFFPESQGFQKFEQSIAHKIEVLRSCYPKVRIDNL